MGNIEMIAKISLGVRIIGKLKSLGEEEILKPNNVKGKHGW
jgi:hypothetical protein